MSTRVQRFIRIAVSAGLMFTSLVACDSDTAKSEESGSAVDEPCGIKLSADAKRAALNLIGTDKYEATSPDGGPTGTASKLVKEHQTYGDSRAHKYDLCLTYKSAADLSATSISFSLIAEEPSKDFDPEFAQYDLGATLAIAKPRNAVLYMNCSSSRFDKGSGEPVVIRGEHRTRTPPDEDSKRLGKENLAVLHSASLALTQALKCKNHAGLPKEFIAHS
ncbi:hypothetical protein [Streptomyces sp. MZ04]|uniref:hypothetical protein n=1 Tax=Streptomyces sp. MZ04 TaxID=2559236 RepID=UPI00107E7CC4|nr:hypothetical protein [Streptomyces sp. MZ04]TGA85688.1 hypothetical protein E2651_41670 [Streptomyces sp. MZ04]